MNKVKIYLAVTAVRLVLAALMAFVFITMMGDDPQRKKVFALCFVGLYAVMLIAQVLFFRRKYRNIK
ncbi:MAG: hypothetical protein KBS94_07960 [Prevotella sp.]|nr:hypothetical protein [Candidatus Equicola faecalis]MDO4819817.1 hypothetical protein [Prevotella sp.]